MFLSQFIGALKREGGDSESKELQGEHFKRRHGVTHGSFFFFFNPPPQLQPKL